MDAGMVGAVLAGGASRRMGRAKADLEIDGVSFLDRAVALLGEVFDEVMVCGGQRSPAGSTLVVDLVPDAGPLSGIASALAAARGRDVFVAAVDMPLLTPEVVRRIASPPPIDGQARVARAGGRIHPLCGAFAADLAAAALEAARTHDRSVIGFLRRVPVMSLVDVPASAVSNVNDPGDLRRIIDELS